MKIVVDENVSQRVVSQLRELGHDVISISEQETSGFTDEQVFSMAVEQQAIIITRDYHFTNPIRFPASKVGAILYIRHGNLTSEEELLLVECFLADHPLEEYIGRLVTLYRGSTGLR